MSSLLSFPAGANAVVGEGEGETFLFFDSLSVDPVIATVKIESCSSFLSLPFSAPCYTAFYELQQSLKVVSLSQTDRKIGGESLRACNFIVG